MRAPLLALVLPLALPLALACCRPVPPAPPGGLPPPLTGPPPASPPVPAASSPRANPMSRQPVDRAARVARAGALLDGWHAAAARADEAGYFACFAPGAVFLGTDAKERWTLPEFRAYAAPHFAKGKAWTFRPEARFVTLDATGDVAWFDETLATENLGPARGSGVLVWQDGDYRIAHYDLGVPIPNERFDEVRALLGRAPPPAAPGR